jgi:hypothetical protein
MSGKRWILFAAVATAAAAAVAVAGVADAAPLRTALHAKDKEAALTGSAVWSDSDFAISGRFDGKLGHGTYTGTLTAGDTRFSTPTCGPVCADVTGTIRFVGNGGRFTAEVQPGGLVQFEDIASHSFRDFTLELRIVDGTGRYSHADGVLSLSYSSVWTHTTINGVDVNRIDDTGTLVGSLH